MHIEISKHKLKSKARGCQSQGVMDNGKQQGGLKQRSLICWFVQQRNKLAVRERRKEGRKRGE